MDGITIDIIREWEFIGKTPAGGKHYFSKELDLCAIDYGRYAKLFYDRHTDGTYAACFRNVKRLNEGES